MNTYFLETSIFRNPFLESAIHQIVTIPEVISAMQEGVDLHQKPLIFTTDPIPDKTNMGAMYDHRTHTVHLDLNVWLINDHVHQYDTPDGGHHIMSIQRAVVHEIGHGRQNFGQLDQIGQEIEDLIALRPDSDAGWKAKNENIFDLLKQQKNEMVRLEDENVQFTDAIMATYFNEPPRQVHKNGHSVPASEADGACLVYSSLRHGESKLEHEAVIGCDIEVSELSQLRPSPASNETPSHKSQSPPRHP